MIGSGLYITLEFTYLRDGLYPWNGKIFMISHEEQLQMEKEQINSKIDSLEQAVRAFEQAKSIDATREGVSARIVNLKAAHRIRE